jgi:hypothetical protein
MVLMITVSGCILNQIQENTDGEIFKYYYTSDVSL